MPKNKIQLKIKHFFPLIPRGMSTGGMVDDLSDFDKFIENVTNLVLVIAAIAIVAMFIWSGFLFVTSGGSEERLKKAKDSLTAAIVGLLIVIFSSTIIMIFQFVLTGKQ